MPLAREVLSEPTGLKSTAPFSTTMTPCLVNRPRPNSVSCSTASPIWRRSRWVWAGILPANCKPSTAPATGEVLLAVPGMESCYGRIKALKGISLEVRRGETVALVGANGAGKTTFLRTLSGVQPMSAGSIHFDGEDISKLRSDMRMRRGICQSPEGPPGVWPAVD
jgi:ABC-type multidrug transport system fused ATPase/permease subunit